MLKSFPLTRLLSTWNPPLLVATNLALTLSTLIARELGHGNVGVIGPGYRRCFSHLDFVVSGGVFRLNPLA